MKKLLFCAGAAVLSMAAAVPCFAAGSPWDGTWKLNTAKSKLTGDTFTFTMKPGGMMHYASGGTINYDFKCDGKPYTIFAFYTVSCTGSPQTGYDFTTIGNGIVMSKSHYMFSGDGKMLTIHGESRHAEGAETSYEEIYKRIGGSSGLAGKWLNVKATESSPAAMVMAVNGNMFKLEYPANKVIIQGKLDGSDSAVIGPTIPPGAFETYKAESPYKLHFVAKYKDKVLDEGDDTLSDGGKVLTEVEWEPGKINQKSVYVYEKQ